MFESFYYKSNKYLHKLCFIKTISKDFYVHLHTPQSSTNPQYFILPLYIIVYHPVSFRLFSEDVLNHHQLPTCSVMSIQFHLLCLPYLHRTQAARADKRTQAGKNVKSQFEH